MTETLISTIAPWFVSALFVVLAVVVLVKIPTLVSSFMGFPWIAKASFILIVIVGAGIRFFAVPNTHRIYFDEDRYMNYAVTFARFGAAHSIVVATPEKLLVGEIDTVGRVTVPTINAIALKLGGYERQSLFTLAKLLSIVQIITIFMATYLLFRSLTTAFAAAGLIALLPNLVFWSTSVGLDSYFVTFSLIAFLGAVWYGQKPGKLSALFLVTTTVLLLFVRLEAFLFLIVELLVIFIEKVRQEKPLLTRQDIQYALIAIPVIGVRALVSFSVLGKTWCCGESTPLEAFDPGYFIRNTIPNLEALFNRPEFPFIITILAIASLFGKKDKRIIPLAAWIVLYFFIYSFYFAGLFYTVEFSGSYGRYFLMIIPPLVILAALSIDSIVKHMMTHKKNRVVKVIALLIAVVLVLLPTINRYNLMITTSPYDKYVDASPRRMGEFLDRAASTYIEGDAIFVHALTNLSLLHGKTAVYFGALLSGGDTLSFVVNEMKNGKPVYMFQTHTCDVYPQKCEALTSVIDFEKVDLTGKDSSGLELVKFKLKEGI